MKKILVTGNLGYIGSVLSNFLEQKNFSITGLDIGLFKDCNLTFCKDPHNQIFKDIRDISTSDLKDINIVIHLAGLSNDPLGKLNAGLTNKINYKATIKLAKLAKKSFIERFIFISTQSIYGISNTNKELDEDKSIKNPITEYASSKWKAECDLLKLKSKDFCVTILRPSTVFGVSPRLRTDIVFNNFVACAFTEGKIEIKSNGKPWRPVVHVNDLCEAIHATIVAPLNKINGEAFNVGILNGNYTVEQLALEAQRSFPSSKIIFLNQIKSNDERTYRVSFKKIHNILGNFYKPKWDLKKGAEELINFFETIKFSSKDFRGNKTIRLLTLQQKLDQIIR